MTKLKKTMETRSLATNLNIGKEEEKKVIEGYFALFDVETELYEGYFERIDKKAFNNIRSDVKALFNHNDSFVLGRTTNGTLDLKVDDKGLYGSILVNENDTEALNLYERVKRGDINQCSFGFVLNNWETDYDDKTNILRANLIEVDLREVSIVTFPAYEATSVSARCAGEKLRFKKENLLERLKKVKKC